MQETSFTGPPALSAPTDPKVIWSHSLISCRCRWGLSLNLYKGALRHRAGVISLKGLGLIMKCNKAGIQFGVYWFPAWLDVLNKLRCLWNYRLYTGHNTKRIISRNPSTIVSWQFSVRSESIISFETYILIPAGESSVRVIPNRSQH